LFISIFRVFKCIRLIRLSAFWSYSDDCSGYSSSEGYFRPAHHIEIVFVIVGATQSFIVASGGFNYLLACIFPNAYQSHAIILVLVFSCLINVFVFFAARPSRDRLSSLSHRNWGLAVFSSTIKFPKIYF
jgi:hypothetical protein